MTNNNKRGRLFFYAILGLLAVGTFFLIKPYINIILVALITVILLRPVYMWLMDRKWIKGRSRIATTLTLLGFFLLLIIPIIIFGTLTISQLIEFFEYLSSLELETSLGNLLVAIEDFLQQIPTLSDIQLDEEQFIQTLQGLIASVLGWLSSVAISLGTSLPALFIGGIIFLVLVASLLPAFDEFNKRVEELSPLDVNISQLYLHKTQVMIVSVIKGVFFLAILQGLVMGVFYWLAGIPFAWFWMLLSMAFAVLPVVGISFIVLPMAIIALISGNITSAIIVLIGFYVFVNPMDLILRPRLVSKEAYLNFTLMLLALFGGIQLAGLLGMIYGPVIMILFLTSLDIYSQYFQDNKESPAEMPEGGETEALSTEPDAGPDTAPS